MRQNVGLPVALLTLSVAAASCGGTGGFPAPTSPSPSPTTGPTDPCAVALGVAAEPRSIAARKVVGPDRHGPGAALDRLWLHETARRRGWLAVAGLRPLAADVGEIAVLLDEGDLVSPPNRFDLTGRGLTFVPNAAGGYDVTTAEPTFRDGLGRRLSLGDDDGTGESLAFTFTFYGHAHTDVFVNSDGNLTFDRADTASTERNVARLLSGAPRLAPFLADLDPSAGGGVFVQSATDRFTVTWCAVPGFDKPQTATVQISLLPDASVEVKYGATVSLGDAVVGVSPGETMAFTPLDLNGGGTGESAAAVGERFAASAQLDIVAVSRKFLDTHADRFDQLVVWTDTSYVTDAFAYEVTVANRIQGIGVDAYDLSAEYGSAGQLSSFVLMDRLGKYPVDPAQTFLGANDTLSLLGQETGHRWLAFLRFLDHDRQASSALLGRDQAHWSFFMDSDASVMEGNDIEALGGGAFRTVAAVRRYSLLDQYAMGLVSEFEVPPFFYVDNPVNVSGGQESTSAPQVGVTFHGTRRDALMADVIAVMGARVPSAADSPKVHRQAFVYVVGAGRTADAAAIDKIDRIRRAWEPFFLQATDGRMRVETRLR